MTYSFLERIGQPAVDLANDREEAFPLLCYLLLLFRFYFLANVFMLFRDKPGWTETQWNVLMHEDFSYNFWFLYETDFIKPERVSRLGLIVEFQFDIGTGFLYAWLRQEMLYSLWDYVHDRLDMLLAFRQILDCRLPTWDDLLWRKRFLDDLQQFLKFGSIRV